MVNASAIESTIRMGLSLNCSIASWCRFARKNYFYPDMPKDYQVSQYDEPLCEGSPRRRRRHGRWSALNSAWRSNASTWKKTPES